MAVRQLAALPGEVAPLFAAALRLIGAIHDDGISNPFWTFGGGTVLMLRYGHRKSKDIDIFVADAQYLGYVNPAKSAVAESLTTKYIETAGSIKLVLDNGEIDFVAAPNLTGQPFEVWEIAGESVRVETAAEIIAKKMWHRGDNTTARDLFDLAAVCEKAPEQIAIAAPHFKRVSDGISRTDQSAPHSARGTVQRDQRHRFSPQLFRMRGNCYRTPA